MPMKSYPLIVIIINIYPMKLALKTVLFPQRPQHALTAMGHQLKAYDGTYGNMQIVIWDYQQNKLDAASDPRGMGQAWVGN